MENKNFGVYFQLAFTFLVRFSWNAFYFQSMERCIGVEWELEQISDFSLLTNQVLKVVYSYVKSSLE